MLPKYFCVSCRVAVSLAAWEAGYARRIPTASREKKLRLIKKYSRKIMNSCSLYIGEKVVRKIVRKTVRVGVARQTSD